MKSLVTLLSVVLFVGQAWALDFDANVPKDIQKQMLEDLDFVYAIQGSGQTPFHKEIFKDVSGAEYKLFLESHVKSVGISACGGGNAVACVMPLFGAKMWLTKNFIEFSHPQIARMMVVYHEARHTERAKANWPHDNCPTPFLDENGNNMTSIWTGASLAGEAACDSTQYGSYGSSTIMLKNISKFCANCTDKVKMDADLYAANQLGRISKPDVKKAMLADFNAKK
ncbi:MAG: hypothetical protein V4736_03970 [Bdellovibrionota bacterium]